MFKEMCTFNPRVQRMPDGSFEISGKKDWDLFDAMIGKSLVKELVDSKAASFSILRNQMTI